MDITDRLNTFLDETGLTLQMLEYASELLVVHKQLQKHAELYNVTSPADLPDQTAITIRKLAQAFGIRNSHAVYSKEQLIDMINTKYAAITKEPDTEEVPMQIESATTELERKIQKPLKIGPPIEYDSEEYFELSIIRDVYSDYPVEIFQKNKTLVLKNSTMDAFFQHFITDLFRKQFRCFKYFRNEWYKFSGNEWVTMFTSEIDGFVLWVYNRLESVARQIDRDLTSAYGLIDITNRNLVLKHATIELKKAIKSCK